MTRMLARNVPYAEACRIARAQPGSVVARDGSAFSVKYRERRSHGGQRADMPPRAVGGAVRLLPDAAKGRLDGVMQHLQPSATSRKPTLSAFPGVIALVPGWNP